MPTIPKPLTVEGIVEAGCPTENCRFDPCGTCVSQRDLITRYVAQETAAVEADRQLIWNALVAADKKLLEYCGCSPTVTTCRVHESIRGLPKP